MFWVILLAVESQQTRVQTVQALKTIRKEGVLSGILDLPLWVREQEEKHVLVLHAAHRWNLDRVQGLEPDPDWRWSRTVHSVSFTGSEVICWSPPVRPVGHQLVIMGTGIILLGVTLSSGLVFHHIFDIYRNGTRHCSITFSISFMGNNKSAVIWCVLPLFRFNVLT